MLSLNHSTHEDQPKDHIWNNSPKTEDCTLDTSVPNIEPDVHVANESMVVSLDFSVATEQTAYIIGITNEVCDEVCEH